MPDYQAIYQNQAAQYDLMVSREDYLGNLLPALQGIHALDGLDVVEVGAGKGPLTKLLAPLVGSLLALDISEHMLVKLRENLPDVSIIASDNRSLPLANGT